MKIDGTQYRSIWFDQTDNTVRAIDQTRLPHHFEIITLNSLDEVCHAILTMQVRGAPLIGAAGAFGVYLALRGGSENLEAVSQKLVDTRPTAVNLQWAVRRTVEAVNSQEGTEERINTALKTAMDICEEDVSNCRAIGEWGADIIRYMVEEKNGRINVLTHCNAGWLATVDRGTALAPVYQAWEEGIDIHVWVDETRPRNQGASLTAWELVKQGIPHTVISDNAGGHLMQTGQVDLCLMGSDRTTYRGNVCNKIGTYLKALAAFDNNVPFYIAVPVSSIDWESDDIPIEERHGEEVTTIQGLNSQGELDTVRLTPAGSTALNHAFDVTPGRLVTGLITELGIYGADEEGLAILKQKLESSENQSKGP